MYSIIRIILILIVNQLILVITIQGKPCTSDSDCGNLFNRQICAPDTRLCIPSNCVSNSQCLSADETKFCSGLKCVPRRGEGGACGGLLGSDDIACLPGLSCISGKCALRFITTTLSFTTTTSSTLTPTTTSLVNPPTETGTENSLPDISSNDAIQSVPESEGVPVRTVAFGVGGTVFAFMILIKSVQLYHRHNNKEDPDENEPDAHIKPVDPNPLLPGSHTKSNEILDYVPGEGRMGQSSSIMQPSPLNASVTSNNSQLMSAVIPLAHPPPMMNPDMYFAPTVAYVDAQGYPVDPVTGVRISHQPIDH